MDIEALIQKAIDSGEDITSELKQKSIEVPSWGELKKEYDPMEHPVMDEREYPDIAHYEERDSTDEVDEFGNPKKVTALSYIERVSRNVYALQQLAVKRTTELCFGIPVSRQFSPENDRQKDIAAYIENIFQRNHIDTVNIDRGNKLFASCEIMTLWYSVLEDNNLYGFDSKLKLRCVTYAPMLGDTLYPLFDEKGDMIALSVEYSRKVKEKIIQYFDTYTATKHLRWSMEEGKGITKALDISEDISIGKIPAVYRFRRGPAWENTSPLVYEMEWAVSRNGNYLRKNSRPILAAFVNEAVNFGQAPGPNLSARDVEQLPVGSSLQYVTWNQAIDNLKFYVNELRQMFFTQLQLPDWSYENMKTSPMSGEARKQLFIDCHLKVRDESGPWLEFFDREVNIIKAYLKQMLPDDWAEDIDALKVKNVITPYTITSESDNINLYVNATGGKPVLSQRTAIAKLGMVSDVDAELRKIQEESMADIFGEAAE